MSGLDNTRPSEKERLRNMYWESGMGIPQIASILNTTQREVSKALDKHDIARRNTKQFCRYRTRKDGYEVCHGTDKMVYLHQLVAISDGEDPHEVFSREHHTHHKNEIRWDNRPDNLELMNRSDHMRHHAEENDLGMEKQYTDEELLSWIDSFVEELGVVPTGKDLKGWPGPSHGTYDLRFGSVKKAVKAAGYTPRSERGSTHE